ncbi:hypothetical protein P0F39_002754 [Vibrio metschnikovii]|nr:hypothetical protein [Vibrio metschnikovii]EKO3888036.1 hypothetical protein [Vibrio metschnikovii]
MLVIKKIVNKIKVKMLNINFIRRVKKAFSRKTPKDYKYPYYLINPIELFSNYKLLDQLYFVGENWFKNKDLPIAVLWGFNDWKLGFSSDYLPEYRTVFVPRKKNSLVANLAISKLIKNCPDSEFVNIIWGYNENRFVNFFIKCRNQPIYRMEDGFLRSAELGASHATPYSLVLDKTGLYFNCSQESDLENILNTHSFSNDEVNLAKQKIKLIIDNNLSKYNQPDRNDFNPLGKSIKHKKRVVVLGQVDSDASIKYGNPDRWDSEKLVKLARTENEDADIFYRPHPDVFFGYQKSFVRRRNLERYAKILSPNEPISSLFDSVDHVYTISSLSGFEALLREIKVTVVGCPFYSGWGVTDDRCSTVFERRKRNLIIEEIFYGAYLLYSRYLGDLDCPNVGFSATAERIIVERDILSLSSKKNDSWVPIAFNNKHLPSHLLNEINYSDFLNKKNDGKLYQVLTVLLFISLAKNKNEKEVVLSNCYIFCRTDAFNEILCLLDYYLNSDIKSDVKFDTAPYFLNLLYSAKDFEHAGKILTSKYDLSLNGNNEINFELLKKFRDVCFENRDIENFEYIIKIILVCGDINLSVIKDMIWILESKYDFKGSQKLISIIKRYNINLFNKNSIMWEMRAKQLINQPLRDFASYVCILKPDKVQNVLIALEGQRKVSEIEYKIIKSIVKMGKCYSVPFVNSLLALEEFEYALEISRAMVIHGDSNDHRIIISYSQALSFCGEIKEAKKLIFNYFKYVKNTDVIQECLRICFIDNDYNSAREFVNTARDLNISIGEMYLRKAYFGMREVGLAFETFVDFHLSKLIGKYYSDKYLDATCYNFDTSLLLLSIFGPGDEIRFASIYRFISNKMKRQLYISCSPKIYPLIQRSFPLIKFISCDRPRNTDTLNISNYNKTKAFEVSSIINNDVSEIIDLVDNMAIVTDFLHVALPSYEAFERLPYLIHDQNKSTEFLSRITTRNSILVGISWRSSITSHSRNEHYLNVSQLSPLFKLDNVTFVNFQYDDCKDELEWVNSNFPGKLIHFDDIDHYNDFDSVAALMKCMDLVISPATTVAELAGALGCKTWLFSNSSELDWRKIDNNNNDVWYENTEIVESDNLGNKELLVDKITEKLTIFIKENLKIN